MKTGMIYICPMHAEVRQFHPGICPRCGMHLVQEGKRFALLHHIVSRPRHLVAMAVAMGALMATIMVLMR